MVGRVWKGWTTSANADAYERLLRERVFPGIAAKSIAGCSGIQLFRRDEETEVEFMTIMWFDSMESVRRFAGEDAEKAYVPPEARAILDRFEERSTHYEIRERLTYSS